MYIKKNNSPVGTVLRKQSVLMSVVHVKQIVKSCQVIFLHILVYLLCSTQSALNVKRD